MLGGSGHAPQFFLNVAIFGVFLRLYLDEIFVIKSYHFVHRKNIIATHLL